MPFKAEILLDNLSFKVLRPISGRLKIILIGLMSLSFFGQCSSPKTANIKPRVLISTDIGGTDPDDFQSMIHLLMYADLIELEGLVASPYGEGRKSSLLDMIDLYEQDYKSLKSHSSDFPEPDNLRLVCKQGAISAANYKGFSEASEGSNWIIKCAKKPNPQALWILVWGGLEDLAQALHDAPEIKSKIKVYWIGGPNKKWSVNAYTYIAEFHPDLWMIEANASYRGWFMDEESPIDIKNDRYFANYIKDRGAMGKAFKNYYEGNIKMGDSPSLTYLLNGDAHNPLSQSWGGSYTHLTHSDRKIFPRHTTSQDTVTTFEIIEWQWPGPVMDIPADSACFILEIWGQKWPGYYLGDGRYAVRYASKKPENGTYKVISDIDGLDGKSGQYVSIIPWPGSSDSQDLQLGKNWFSDRIETEWFVDIHQGARTVSIHREAFLRDWAKRWEWLE